MNSSYGQFPAPRTVVPFAWGQLPVAPDGGPPIASTPASSVAVVDPAGVGVWDLAVGYMPVAQAFAAQLQDKYKLMVNAERKLRDARMAGMSAAYVARLEANYLAARRGYERQQSGERSIEQFRLIGQTAGIVGIGLGVAGIIFVLSKAMGGGGRR